MPEAEFNAWQFRRNAYIRILDGAEAVLVMLILAWSIEMMLLPKGTTMDPISNAIMGLVPGVSIHDHGFLLFGLAVMHLFACKFKNPDLRCVCCFGETLFFLYAWWSIVLAHIYVPALFCQPVLIVFSSLNFATLLPRPEARKWANLLKRGG